MSYKTQANHISRNKTVFSNSLTTIKTIDFNSIWKGPAKDVLTSALLKTVDALDKRSMR